MSIVQDGGRDHGIPLPGSDPERRARIKSEINRLKGYLLLYRIDEGCTLVSPLRLHKKPAEFPIGTTSAP